MSLTSTVSIIDCMSGMKTHSDKYFDLGICDIPYGINVAKMAYTQEDNRPVKQKNGNTLRIKKAKYIHKDWDTVTPPQEYFNELCRITKHQIIFGIEYTNWIGVGPGRIRWDKRVPDGLSFSRYEVAYCSLISSEIEIPLLWAGMMQAKSIKEPTTMQGNKKLNEKRIHPCHKPIMLYDILFQKFIPNGGRVIDTHLGGGSSRISADRAGNIDFTGYEIDADYLNPHIERWNKYKSIQSLFF